MRFDSAPRAITVLQYVADRFPFIHMQNKYPVNQQSAILCLLGAQSNTQRKGNNDQAGYSSMQFRAVKSGNTTSPAYRAGDLTIEVARGGGGGLLHLRQHIH